MQLAGLNLIQILGADAAGMFAGLGALNASGGVGNFSQFFQLLQQQPVTGQPETSAGAASLLLSQSQDSLAGGEAGDVLGGDVSLAGILAGEDGDTGTLLSNLLASAVVNGEAAVQPSGGVIDAPDNTSSEDGGNAALLAGMVGLAVPPAIPVQQEMQPVTAALEIVSDIASGDNGAEILAAQQAQLTGNKLRSDLDKADDAADPFLPAKPAGAENAAATQAQPHLKPVITAGAAVNKDSGDKKLSAEDALNVKPASHNSTHNAAQAAPSQNAGDGNGNLTASNDNALSVRGADQANVQFTVARTQSESLHQTALKDQQEVNAAQSSQVMEQVKVKIQNTAKEGLDRVTIQLDPPNLGRIHIRMDMAHEGKTGLMIMADNPETLDLLQRDSRDLARALSDAGIKADAGSMQFAQRGGGQPGMFGFGGWNGNGGGNGNGNSGASPAQENNAAVPLDEITRSYRMRTGNGLDITV